MLTLHPTDKHEVAYTEDQAELAEAARAARALRGAGADCSARAMLILAAQRFPDDDLVLAAKKMTAEFEVFRSQIKLIAAEVEAKKKAENERLSPWIGPVLNRQGSIKAAIEQIHQNIEALNRRQSQPNSRALALRRQGVSQAEVERLLGREATVDDLLARKVLLKAEQEKIDLFFTTKDPSVLPAGIHPRMRIEPSPLALDSDAKAMVENSVIG